MRKTFTLFTLLILCISCSEWVEYSPYDTDISKRHPNKDEIKLINSISTLSGDENFSFILLSDIHDCYDELEDAISSINKRNDIRFVVCCGDITNAGLIQQYEWYVDIIRKCRHPLINVIGNHDCRSNGCDIYAKVFGPSNYSFISGDYKFILFDNVIWEKGNKAPDYAWLKNETSDTLYNHIVLSHIPIWGDQMAAKGNEDFRQITVPENVMLCLHGHEHHYKDSVLNGTRTIVSESLNMREYYVITLKEKRTMIETVKY